MRRFSLILHVFILILFFLLQYHFLSFRTQSFHFQDENEHLGPSWAMIHQNLVLYHDLSTNHQPLPILMGFIFWKIIPYINFFMLIERVRQIMFLISFIGALLLVVRFGKRGLYGVFFIEIIKFYLLGYHFLAESLIVYPLMYLTGILFERALVKKSYSFFIQMSDDILWGIAAWFICFSLLPAIPFIILSSVFYLWIRRCLKSLLSIFLSFTIPTFFLFKWISIADWYRETITNNLSYFLPYESKSSVVSLLLHPFLSIFNLQNPLAFYFAGFLTLVILSIVLQIKRKGLSPRLILIICLWYILFFSLNTRVSSWNISFTSAFHLLPQYAFLTMSVSTLLIPELILLKKTMRNLFFYSALLLSIFIFISSSSWWVESGKFDKVNDHFIQYGEYESIANAIETIATPGDTLLAGAQNSYINIASKVPLSYPQTAYLNWSYRSSLIRYKFEKHILAFPPTFIYFPEDNNSYLNFIKTKVLPSYIQIRRLDSGKTSLYIRKESIPKKSQKQWEDFKGLFYLPPIESSYSK